MYTVSDILADIDRGCAANNMIEDCFSYRIIFYVNEGDKSLKHSIDTSYNGLRGSLESIIRGYLSVMNTIVVAAVTARKDGQPVSLLGRAYAFSLDGYFELIAGRKEKGYIRNGYGRRKAGWC
ncbi:hypothetical protein IMSAGC019_02623 [Lachnospiraceae bacterium]|nr:hypothetical protein IMSAGC019_02623 [Lachnospiraceae bacterium]